MAKKSQVKTFFTITDMQTKTVYEPVFKRYHRVALIAVEFRRSKRKWRKAFQVNYEGPISMERFINMLHQQNIDPDAVQDRMTEELEPYLNQELELPKVDG